ncbi:MAG: CpsD/CapB family tyrosine-protein kinase [Nitrospirae bacterium]|nr:CpsD/CapB family tyrosine-protein kinase [Nitrospirota bacterium]
MRMDWIKRKRTEDGNVMTQGADERVPVMIDEAGNRINSGVIDNRLVTLKEPASISAEQYRILFTRVAQLRQEASSYALAVTSSVKAEGKTFTSLNLAISIARDFDEKVLLIEGDLKNPGLYGYLKHPPGFGLTDVLVGKIDIESCAVKMFDGQLSVLFAGKTVGNPSRLISSIRMQQIMKTVRENYKYIIIDTPPIIPLADINIYSKLVDGILLVIQAGKTPRSIVKRATSTLAADKVVGVVLNCVEPIHSKYYYGSGYDNY